MTASVARKMGRYETLFRIASGGMAEVWAARVRGEAGFQKLVAIKRMLPNLAEDEDFVAMFLDEARVAANITSPNVVQTLDLGRDDEGALYIVMELVVGVTLGRVLKAAAAARKVVPLGIGAELIAQAAHGLHDAHEATTPLGDHLQIVHRDISPQNILLGVDGRVRITDFGVAKAVMRITQTDAGRIKGKFAYCSPEQLESPEIDRRSDIFSLGIVAWETLCGQRLFSAEHPLETMKRVTSMPIPAVNQIRTRVPQEVSDVVAWALERDPAKRPPTAAAFGDALRQAVREHEEAPDARALSTFVKAAGGKSLARMRKNIQDTLSSDALPYVTDSTEAQLPTPSVSSVVSRSGASDSAAGVLGLLDDRSDAKTEELGRLPDDAPTVAWSGRAEDTVPAEDAVPSVDAAPTQGEASGPSVGAIAGAALLLLAIGLVAGYFMFSRSASRAVSGPPLPSPSASASPAAPPPPAAVTATTEAPATAPDTGIGEGAGDATSTAEGEETAVDQPSPNPSTGSSRRHATWTRGERATTPSMTSRPRPIASTTAPSAARAATMTASSMATATMTAPSVAGARGATMMTSMRRSGGLVGLDSFERDLGR